MNTARHRNPKYKPRNKSFSKKKPAKKKNNLPLLSFISLELSSRTTSAAIIRINKLISNATNGFDFKSTLHTNKRKKVRPEATAYHGITADMLVDKPEASSENFSETQYIVVWDGEVTKNIFRTNGIYKYAKIINLQNLARLNKHALKPIKLIDYAKEVLPQKRLQLEITMRNPNNKIHVLPDIYEQICKKYMNEFGECSPMFLSNLGQAKNRSELEQRAQSFLQFRKKIAPQLQKHLIDKKAQKNNGNGVIKVNVTSNPAIKVAIIKKKNSQ